MLVSAEIEEVTALADRLLVIKEGEIVGEVNPKVTSNRGYRLDDGDRLTSHSLEIFYENGIADLVAVGKVNA